MGRVIYIVTTQLDAVRAVFEAAGIEAECCGPGDRDDVFVHVRHGEHTVTVSAHMKEQMLQETMSTRTLRATVIAMLDGLDAGLAADEKRMLFFDERWAWPTLSAVLRR